MSSYAGTIVVHSARSGMSATVVDNGSDWARTFRALPRTPSPTQPLSGSQHASHHHNDINEASELGAFSFLGSSTNDGGNYGRGAAAAAMGGAGGSRGRLVLLHDRVGNTLNSNNNTNNAGGKRRGIPPPSPDTREMFYAAIAARDRSAAVGGFRTDAFSSGGGGGGGGDFSDDDDGKSVGSAAAAASPYSMQFDASTAPSEGRRAGRLHPRRKKKRSKKGKKASADKRKQSSKAADSRSGSAATGQRGSVGTTALLLSSGTGADYPPYRSPSSGGAGGGQPNASVAPAGRLNATSRLRGRFLREQQHLERRRGGLHYHASPAKGDGESGQRGEGVANNNNNTNNNLNESGENNVASNNVKRANPYLELLAGTAAEAALPSTDDDDGEEGEGASLHNNSRGDPLTSTGGFDDSAGATLLSPDSAVINLLGLPAGAANSHQQQQQQQHPHAGTGAWPAELRRTLAAGAAFAILGPAGALAAGGKGSFAAAAGLHVLPLLPPDRAASALTFAPREASPASPDGTSAPRARSGTQARFSAGTPPLPQPLAGRPLHSSPPSQQQQQPPQNEDYRHLTDRRLSLSSDSSTHASSASASGSGGTGVGGRRRPPATVPRHSFNSTAVPVPSHRMLHGPGSGAAAVPELCFAPSVAAAAYGGGVSARDLVSSRNPAAYGMPPGAVGGGLGRLREGSPPGLAGGVGAHGVGNMRMQQLQLQQQQQQSQPQTQQSPQQDHHPAGVHYLARRCNLRAWALTGRCELAGGAVGCARAMNVTRGMLEAAAAWVHAWAATSDADGGRGSVPRSRRTSVTPRVRIDEEFLATLKENLVQALMPATGGSLQQRGEADATATAESRNDKRTTSGCGANDCERRWCSSVPHALLQLPVLGVEVQGMLDGGDDEESDEAEGDAPGNRRTRRNSERSNNNTNVNVNINNSANRVEPGVKLGSMRSRQRRLSQYARSSIHRASNVTGVNDSLQSDGRHSRAEEEEGEDGRGCEAEERARRRRERRDLPRVAIAVATPLVAQGSVREALRRWEEAAQPGAEARELIIRRVVRAVLEQVAACHAAGAAHGDVKATNVFALSHAAEAVVQTQDAAARAAAAAAQSSAAPPPLQQFPSLPLGDTAATAAALAGEAAALAGVAGGADSNAREKEGEDRATGTTGAEAPGQQLPQQQTSTTAATKGKKKKKKSKRKTTDGNEAEGERDANGDAGTAPQLETAEEGAAGGHDADTHSAPPQADTAPPAALPPAPLTYLFARERLGGGGAAAARALPPPSPVSAAQELGALEPVAFVPLRGGGEPGPLPASPSASAAATAGGRRAGAPTSAASSAQPSDANANVDGSGRWLEPTSGELRGAGDDAEKTTPVAPSIQLHNEWGQAGAAHQTGDADDYGSDGDASPTITRRSRSRPGGAAGGMPTDSSFRTAGNEEGSGSGVGGGDGANGVGARPTAAVGPGVCRVPLSAATPEAWSSSVLVERNLYARVEVALVLAVARQVLAQRLREEGEEDSREDSDADEMSNTHKTQTQTQRPQRRRTREGLNNTIHSDTHGDGRTSPTGADSPSEVPLVWPARPLTPRGREDDERKETADSEKEAIDGAKEQHPDKKAASRLEERLRWCRRAVLAAHATGALRFFGILEAELIPPPENITPEADEGGGGGDHPDGAEPLPHCRAFRRTPNTLRPRAAATFAADVWALGLMALELADGGAGLPYWLYRLRRPAPALRTRPWSAQFYVFVSRCLETRPERRPTAQALLADPWFSSELLAVPSYTAIPGCGGGGAEAAEAAAVGSSAAVPAGLHVYQQVVGVTGGALAAQWRQLLEVAAAKQRRVGAGATGGGRQQLLTGPSPAVPAVPGVTAAAGLDACLSAEASLLVSARLTTAVVEWLLGEHIRQRAAHLARTAAAAVQARHASLLGPPAYAAPPHSAHAASGASTALSGSPVPAAGTPPLHPHPRQATLSPSLSPSPDIAGQQRQQQRLQEQRLGDTHGGHSSPLSALRDTSASPRSLLDHTAVGLAALTPLDVNSPIDSRAADDTAAAAAGSLEATAAPRAVAAASSSASGARSHSRSGLSAFSPPPPPLARGGGGVPQTAGHVRADPDDPTAHRGGSSDGEDGGSADGAYGVGSISWYSDRDTDDDGSDGSDQRSDALRKAPTTGAGGGTSVFSPVLGAFLSAVAACEDGARGGADGALDGVLQAALDLHAASPVALRAVCAALTAHTRRARECAASAAHSDTADDDGHDKKDTNAAQTDTAPNANSAADDNGAAPTATPEAPDPCPSSFQSFEISKWVLSATLAARAAHKVPAATL